MIYFVRCFCFCGFCFFFLDCQRRPVAGFVPRLRWKCLLGAFLCSNLFWIRNDIPWLQAMLFCSCFCVERDLRRAYFFRIPKVGAYGSKFCAGEMDGKATTDVSRNWSISKLLTSAAAFFFFAGVVLELVFCHFTYEKTMF